MAGQTYVAKRRTRRTEEAIEATESALRDALQAGIARGRSRRLTEAVESFLEALEEEL